MRKPPLPITCHAQFSKSFPKSICLAKHSNGSSSLHHRFDLVNTHRNKTDNTAIMRLTADLINSSLSYLNPLKERELDLRGESTEKSRYLHFESPATTFVYTRLRTWLAHHGASPFFPLK